MKKYMTRPYDDDSSRGDYNILGKARKKRSKLDLAFFTRIVVIIDRKTYREVK